MLKSCLESLERYDRSATFADLQSIQKDPDDLRIFFNRPFLWRGNARKFRDYFTMVR